MAQPTVDALCQQARQAIADRHWDKARKAYLEALALKPNSADIHQGLATVCFQLRDLPAAAQHFKEVTRLDPLRAGAFINLGAIYNLLDQLDDAINVLRRGIQLDAQRSEGYYNLGLVYRRKGQVDLAIHAYREALRVNPRLADATYNLGNLYYEKEQYRQAIECYQKAMELRTDFEKARLGLEQAREALEIQEKEQGGGGDDADALDSAAPIGPTSSRKLDPTRTVDPEHHGVVLSALHKATIEAENTGRNLLELTEQELEPAIKELSAALVSPDVTITVLDQCLERFESAMRNARTLQDSLAIGVQKVRMIGDQLVTDAS